MQGYLSLRGWVLPEYAVIAEDLSVSVNDHEILSGFNVVVPKGSILLLSGPSGSGKTTLLKVMAGLIPELYPKYVVSGNVSVFGLEPSQALREGLVAYVPQDPSSYFLNASVATELLYAGISTASVDIPVNKLMHELSDGQLYRLLLTVATSSGAKLLLLDEPTSHIDPWTLPQVMGMLREFCARGGSVVLVDHRVEVLRGFIDAHVVLRGREWRFPSLGLRRSVRCGSPSNARTAVMLHDVWVSLTGLSVLKGVTFEVRRGSAFSVVGRNGVGKTTLLRVVSGLLSPDRGVVRVSGRVFYVPQVPVRWFSSDTVRGEVELFARAWGFRDSVDEVLDAFHLDGVGDRHPFTLSVGESRRLALALAYVSSADVVVLDEPGLGLDPSARESLIDCLSAMMGEGTTVLTAGHDLALAKSLGDACLLDDGVLRC